MTLELSNHEQVRMQMAESARTMASTDFWKALVKAMVNDETNCLAELDGYLTIEAHPDREEVMTLCLKWHARRQHRRLLLENVEQARHYKAIVHDSLLEQFMTDPSQPLSEEAQRILLESGEMYADPGTGSAPERG